MQNTSIDFPLTTKVLRMPEFPKSTKEKSLPHIELTMEFSELPGIHGFVHGHIHKHKDHTHIHGHIHNHDHDQHFNPGQLCDIDEEACRDIMCDELDDCQFNHCDEVLAPPAPHLALTNEANRICTDPLCIKDPRKVVLDCCGPQESPECGSSGDCDQKACESQQNNTILFKNIIESVQLGIDNDDNQPEPAAKRQKIQPPQFELHFPHQCHQEPAFADQDVPKTENHHHYNQLCFHTTIPNVGNAIPEAQPPALPAPQPLMLDYDFYIQFNNLNQQTCQWDNCDRQLPSEQLMAHLEQDHIVKVEGDRPRYHCEWADCNFMEDLWENFVAHLGHHQPHEVIRPPSPAAKSPVVTSPARKKPVSITKVKINPKKKEPIDPTHTCKWEIADGVTCNKLHASAGDLQNHLIEEHVGLGRLKYSCKWTGCVRHHGKEFIQRQKLLRHIHIHTNYKPFKCDECGLTFATTHMLQQHLRTHLGEKPYKCNICGKRFAANSSLSIHNRVHTGEKPLVCKYPGCGKRFSESLNLTKHMKVHERFDCSECELSFDKKTPYALHLQTDHGKVASD